MVYLQGILEQLVHLGHLRGDGKIDGAVGNLDNDTATDLRVDLGNDLDALALEDVVRLGDGALEAAEGPAVERRSAGNDQLNLSPVRTHEHTKFLHNTLQHAQAVVLGESREEVLYDALLIGIANVLLEFLDNLLLVRDGEGGGVQDLAELGVLLENCRERLERLCGGVEGVGFGGCGVLPIIVSEGPPASLPVIPSARHRTDAN